MSKQPATPADADRPKRLTLSEIVEHLLQRGGSDKSSVSISRNAKGGHQLEVTGRTADEDGMRTVGEVAGTVAAIYDRLRLRYPMEGDDAPIAAAADSPELQAIRARAEAWLAGTPGPDVTPSMLARDIISLLHTQQAAAPAAPAEAAP